MIELYKYGMPKGVDAEEVKKEFDEMAQYLENRVKDPEALRNIYTSAQMSGHLSHKDLQKQFTC